MKRLLKSNLLFWIFALLLSIVFIGCENTGGSGSSGPESGAVSGHVYLEGTFKPITNVVVSCAGIADTTQKSGHYLITNIPAGSRTITAINSHYESYSTTIIVRSDETSTFDIFLRYDEAEN